MLPRAAITGIGMSEVSRVVRADPWDRTIDAALAAIADAGLTVDDIDGVSTYPGAAGSSHDSPGFSGAGVYDAIRLLGLSPRWFTGGEELPGQLGAVINATLAVASGVADHVLCFRTVHEASAQDEHGSRAALVTGFDPGGDGTSTDMTADGALEHLLPYGAMYPVLAALDARRYFHDSGCTRRQLAQIALNGRANASRNPHAVVTAPLTMEAYLGARLIAEPLCILDCDIPVDGSVAVVVSALGKAGSDRPPVVIESFGSAPGFDACSRMLWANTDLTPADVEVGEIYDGFSIYTLHWLEALGLCGPGEAGRFVEGGGRIALDGSLPLSTGGGQLSAGRLHGFGHVHEACLQLWALGGDRQVTPSPRVAVVSNGAESFTGALLLSSGR